MKPRFENQNARHLVGICRRKGAGTESTADLWKEFMPRRREIKNRVNSDLISMRVFYRSNDDPLTRKTPFDEWVAVEVSETIAVPGGMESYRVPEGLYAIFIHRGPASRAPRTMEFIFGEWLPNADCTLDDRPHLAIMGADYKRDDPEAEEEIWIPVSLRSQADNG